jgi:hypothetical protein
MMGTFSAEMVAARRAKLKVYKKTAMTELTTTATL